MKYESITRLDQAPPEMSRRKLLRIGAASMFLLATKCNITGSSEGARPMVDMDKLYDDLPPAPVSGDVAATPDAHITEPRAHDDLERNQYGFYELPVYGGESITPTAIVLHWTAANYDPQNSVQGVINGLAGNPACGSEGCSVQLFIDREGATFQLTPRLETRAIHARGMNNHSVGVEIEGSSEVELLNNPVQYDATLRVTNTLRQIFGIPLYGDAREKTGILGHLETDIVYGPGNKQDPGGEFMQKVRSDIAS